MEQIQQYFLQFILNRGIVTIEETINYLKKIDPEFSSNALKKLIIDANKAISEHFFKILPKTCEITEKHYIVFINTKADDITKSDRRRINYLRCLNLSSTLSSPLSIGDGEIVLNKWIEGGYYVKKADYVYLGPRCILEFCTVLKDCGYKCPLCSDMVFTGKICGSCDKIFHSYCIKKYLQNQSTCPDCKNDWEEVEFFQSSQKVDED